MMKCLVAVPVFNEERYLVRVLNEIRKYAPHVLAIDDGSTDATPQLLQQQTGVAVLTHPENRGYGQSLIDAFRYAAHRGYDWVLTMDCDEQHEPSKIPAFFAAAAENDSDIISGSRYLKTDDAEGQPPVDRRNINRLMTDLINSTLNLDLTDSFCGFKAHRVSAMEQLRLTIPGYAFPMQFWVQAANAKLRIRELPVKLIYKDATRHFGGELDDPTVRLQHYMEVLTNEIASVRRNRAPEQREPCWGRHILAGCGSACG